MQRWCEVSCHIHFRASTMHIRAFFVTPSKLPFPFSTAAATIRIRQAPMNSAVHATTENLTNPARPALSA
jgi:hypothetical protein